MLTIASLVLVPFLKPADGLLFAESRAALSGWPGEVGRDLLISVFGVVGAIVQVRRGRTVSSQLLWVVGIVCSTMLVDSLRPPFASGWSVQGLVCVLAVVVLAAGVWLLHKGRLTRTGAVALASALAVTLVFPVRDLLADPVTALVGTGLASVLLLSAIWQLLTEGAPTRRDTLSLPREARLAFYLGYQLLWVITATVVVLTRESLFGDVVIAVELGDRVFGTTLLLVAVLGLLTVALRQPPRTPSAPLVESPGGLDAVRGGSSAG